MRISDWSSDVCSSDLLKTAAGEHIAGVYRQRLNLTSGRIAMIDNGLGFQFVPWSPPLENKLHQHIAGVARDGAGSNGASAGNVRSEEHTSELQSLMRISYAVFCLKKKKKQTKVY